MSDRLVLPIALWGPEAPTHRISSVHMMNNEKILATGSQDGQICLWDVEQDPLLSITPRCLIFGHSSKVLCIADGDFTTKNTLVSSSDEGEMCLWNIEDGQCIETKKTQYTHTFIKSFKVSVKDCRLFCVGYYAEILVMDPKTFEIRFRLSSKDDPDWISSIHILQPPQLGNIVIIGASITGIVRIWTITDETSKSLDPIYDNDRKALDCSRSVQIVTNPESMRLILIVCAKRWQIYDATDFKQLCTVEATDGRWIGGNFITRDQVLVWTDKGGGHLYHVTTKAPSATRLKATLSCKTSHRYLYSPKMCLASNATGKLLIRGDDTGSLTIWSILASSTTLTDQVTTMMPKLQQPLDVVWRTTYLDEKKPPLARLTGRCLSHLLFVPTSPNIPFYTTLRHTAVGLIGRGFTIWEPYLDAAKVLLGLLDMSCEPENPKADTQDSSATRQAAKDAISAIACARPTVFITTLAIEVTKYNIKLANTSSRASSQNRQPQPVLVRARAEILRNIGILVESVPIDVANLIVESMDIILHCIDHSLLENRGLGEAFPAITRFYMVSYCSSSRRIAVGTITGNLALYELRQRAKPQIVAAHKSAISSCSFSPDGKYLASYSAGDNKLCFWLTATGLFGLGILRTRCVGAIDTPPVSADLLKSPSDQLKVARLIWVASKVVILMFIDGREFRYQVAS